MTPDLLSVVVIGRNEGARLVRCLESIHAMHAGDLRIEILYVDSSSTDGSGTKAHSLGAEVIALTGTRTTAAMGRNAGWRAARGRMVLFLDGDTVLHPDFVAKARATLEQPTAAVVWGHRREIATRDSLYNRVLDLDWIYGAGDTEFCGGDALFRRDVLEATGAFDETLIAGEEPELCRRITARGLRIVHIDEPMTGHDLDIHHFSQYWQRAKRAGHAFAEVSERFRTSANPFWLADAKRNRTRALALLGLAAVDVCAAIVLRSAWVLVGALLCFALLALRTAWKARWKTHDRVALLLYGVHSHLQQIPIYVGQLGYRRHRRKGTRAELVEYKQG